MTARQQLATAIAPLLPATWKLIPYQDSIDTLSSVVVMLKLESIEKAPSAPIGAYLAKFTVTIADPSTDPKNAEDRLDDEVLALLAALDALNSTLWSTATKVSFNSTNLAYDIAVSVVTRKD